MTELRKAYRIYANARPSAVTIFVSFELVFDRVPPGPLIWILLEKRIGKEEFCVEELMF